MMQSNELSEYGMKWLLSLEREHLPIELARHHPRVVNKLALTWNLPGEGREYLDSLLLDNRGDRQGFSMPILRELIALRELYNQMHPEITEVWDKGHLAHPVRK